jgi:hypothetical protein
LERFNDLFADANFDQRRAYENVSCYQTEKNGDEATGVAIYLPEDCSDT